MLRNAEDARLFAQSVLADFAIDSNAHVEFVKYRENHVYKAVNGKKAYAVRIHRRHYRTNDELLSEVEFVSRLRQNGMFVPRQLKTVGGENFLVKPDYEGEDYQIDIQEWIEDTSPLDNIANGFDGTSSLNTEDFFKLGVLAANLHAKTREIGIGNEFKRHAWDGEGLIGKNAVWGDPMRAFSGSEERSLMIKVFLKIRQNLEHYGKSEKRYGPIHGDLTPENILVRGNDLILIDFDDCGFGWYIFELTTALMFYQPHPLFDEYLEAAFTGYESVLPIDDATRKIWPAMLLARGMTYLGWAYDRRGDEASNFLLAELKPYLINKSLEYLEKNT